MILPFATLDVFTDRPFGGNPLAVFPDAAHLPAALMQRIAREMNLSETVFLGPPESEDATARVRIFTPGAEVPFAGHPTVGAAIHLARAYVASGGGNVAEMDAPGAEHGAPAPTLTLVLEENVGLVPVEIRFEAGEPVFARFTAAVLPELRPSPLSREELAGVAGVPPDEIVEGELRPAMASCGLPFHVIPVRSLDAIRSASLDMALWGRLVAPLWADHVYLVCMETEAAGADVHVRMFDPAVGVPEDPATGSAAAALGGYLAAAGEGAPDGTHGWVVEQGLEIGRSSVIHVEAVREGGRTTAVRVGGGAVPMLRGVMTAPD